MAETRRCSICRRILPLDDEHFFRDAARETANTPGFRYWCKQCCVERERDWSQRNRERRREVNREYMRRRREGRRERAA